MEEPIQCSECPMCGSPMIKRTFSLPKGLRIFGLSLEEVLKRIQFSREKGYKDDKSKSM